MRPRPGALPGGHPRGPRRWPLPRAPPGAGARAPSWGGPGYPGRAQGRALRGTWAPAAGGRAPISLRSEGRGETPRETRADRRGRPAAAAAGAGRGGRQAGTDEERRGRPRRRPRGESTAPAPEAAPAASLFSPAFRALGSKPGTKVTARSSLIMGWFPPRERRLSL